MNLYEYEAKRIFADGGIPVPTFLRITRPEELAKAHFGYPLVLKCQVLSGGRGKAGGIKFAATLQEGQEIARQLLTLVIRGSKTESLIVEPKVAIKKELYLAITLDREAGCPVFIASAEGGIDIESSKAVIKMPITYPLRPYVARNLARKLGLRGQVFTQTAAIASKLLKLFEEKDLDLAEINPLVITEGDDVLALDGKITVNDDALARQPYFDGWTERHLVDLPERERKARLAGLNLVELEGNIGIMSNGAGLTMATMDMVKAFGGRPGNFLDAGGGSDQAKTLAALELVHSKPEVEVILINILGGITACDEVASAIMKFMSAHPERKLVVRLRGNNQERAAEMLSTTGIKLHLNLDEAVRAAVNAAAPATTGGAK